MTPTLLMFSEYGILILRIVLAAILVAHGIPKIRHFSRTVEQFRELGVRPARVLAGVAAVVEVGGGACLLLGFFTQFAALAVALQFLFIVLYVKRHSRTLVGGYELDLLLFAGSLALVTLGAGAWSIDSFLRIILY